MECSNLNIRTVVSHIPARCMHASLRIKIKVKTYYKQTSWKHYSF